MIKLTEEEKKLIEPIVENLDELLKNDNAEEIVDQIAFSFGKFPTDYVYTENDIQIEKIMDYLYSKYC